MDDCYADAGELSPTHHHGSSDVAQMHAMFTETRSSTVNGIRSLSASSNHAETRVPTDGKQPVSKLVCLSCLRRQPMQIECVGKRPIAVQLVISTAVNALFVHAERHHCGTISFAIHSTYSFRPQQVSREGTSNRSAPPRDQNGKSLPMSTAVLGVGYFASICLCVCMFFRAVS